MAVLAGILLNIIRTKEANMEPPIQQLNLLSVFPGTVGGTTSFSFMFGGVFILRSLLSLSVNPCINELPPDTITLPYRLYNAAGEQRLATPRNKCMKWWQIVSKFVLYQLSSDACVMEDVRCLYHLPV